MANTRSAKKTVRSSKRKAKNNTFWKIRIKKASKNLENLLKDGANIGILNESLTNLQKIVDKATKNKVIHKNKANRIKSKFAEKITANDKKKTTKKSATNTTKTKKS